MQDAYVLWQFSATVFLIVFSIGLGYLKLRYFGFGFHGLLDRQGAYEKRRATRIGKRVHRPRLIRHAENPYLVFGLSILPTVVNGGFLLALLRYGQYVLVPALALPLAIVELLSAWYIQKLYVPSYQSDYDDYMRLTEPGNRYFDGAVVEQSGGANSLLSGGRLVRVSRISRGGQVKQLRLFVSYDTDVRYPVRKVGNDRLRIFYRPYGTPDPKTSIVVDGELVGFQTKAVSPLSVDDPSYSDFEQRVGAN